MPGRQFFEIRTRVSVLDSLRVFGWLIIFLVKVVESFLLGLFDVSALIIIELLPAFLRGEHGLRLPVRYGDHGVFWAVKIVGWLLFEVVRLVLFHIILFNYKMMKSSFDIGQASK